ncbi:MAG: type II secretion system secretin GspD [Gammaproteobacteria bacterium]|nr:type II secretion system secretin GspD [Gammaproteobacteria bacterium]
MLLLSALEAGAAGVTLNLEGADIGALIATVSEITGKNFVVDPRVKGKVTVISSQPMGKEEVYQVFLSILQTHGFAAIPSGPVVKVVPDANARQISAQPLQGEVDPEGDAVTTRVIRLDNVNAAQLVPLLRPLVPQEGHLAAYPSTNTLIISDRSANIRRLLEIVRRVDQATDSNVDVIRLRHASAAEIVKILTALEQKPQAGEAPRPPAVLSADERTNTLLISGDAPSRLRLRTLAAHLDTPVEATGNTQVIYLRYAKAKELVPVLTGVSDQTANADARALAAATTPAGGGGGRKDLTVVAEERSNALVITAPPSAMQTIRAVIRQLDIRRAQVQVEAIIAEISPNRAAELGVQWRTGIPGTGSFAGFRTPSGSRFPNIDETDTAKLAGGLSLGYMEGGNLRFLLRAIAEDGTSNVLSTPTLVTLDNEEAEIVVGQNVPFVTGSYTTSTGGGGTVGGISGNPFQTFQRQDVGILLKVKPQINEGDAIRMEVKQEVSSVIPGTSGETLQLNKRSVDTKVMVDDGQILVLGGLIEDKLSESIAKVPLLGDIPILGTLFRDRRISNEKVNLMVFLKPTILRNAADGTMVSSAKYSHLRAQQESYQPKETWLIPNLKREVLPPWPADQGGGPTGGGGVVGPAPEPAPVSEPAPEKGREVGEPVAPFSFPWES